jgi:hypothetical protein
MADYGLKGYIKSTEDKHQQEQELMLKALSSLKEDFNVDAGFEDCELFYDYIDTKPIYNAPVHYTCNRIAYDKDMNELGIIGVNILQIGDEIACKVFITPPIQREVFHSEYEIKFH